jgi:Family of unknown function (DUF5715)
MPNFTRAILIGVLSALCLVAFVAAHGRTAFPGSRQSLLEQNDVTKDLPRYADLKAMLAAVDRGELSKIDYTECLKVHVPFNRAFLRPEALTVLNQISLTFYQRYHKPLQINSAVRTLQDQRRLRRWNRNAAAVTGQAASVHPTGYAFDLQRRGLNRAQLGYLRDILMFWRNQGLIIVEEEVKQPCFHVVAIPQHPGRPEFGPETGLESSTGAGMGL